MDCKWGDVCAIRPRTQNLGDKDRDQKSVMVCDGVWGWCVCGGVGRRVNVHVWSWVDGEYIIFFKCKIQHSERGSSQTLIELKAGEFIMHDVKSMVVFENCEISHV